MQELQEKISSVPAQQRSINETIMRVRKLRWAGMDEEAERLVKELERQLPGGVGAESVLPTRLETD